jgi:hypothetical protein
MNDIKSEIGEQEDELILNPVDTRTPEQKAKDDAELEKLDEQGKHMAHLWRDQQRLKDPALKQLVKDDPRLILYRLPLSDEQRERLHEKISKDIENRNKLNEQLKTLSV